MDSYQLIQNTKVPPHEEIFRHISFEPETQMTNLPLSIFNLIHFGDSIGATDQILLTMLTIYLKIQAHCARYFGHQKTKPKRGH